MLVYFFSELGVDDCVGGLRLDDLDSLDFIFLFLEQASFFSSLMV